MVKFYQSRFVFLLLVLFLVLSVLSICSSPAAQTIFYENFESSWGDWSSDNGIWEIGTPSNPNIGPQRPHDRPEWDANNLQCAGTILNEYYESDTNSMLISPTIQLPGTGSLQENEEIYLRFQHWFFYRTSDQGYVKIRYQDDKTGSWSNWEKICDHPIQYSRIWTVKGADLTIFAGKRIRLGFFHKVASGKMLDGWYIDDVEIKIRQICQVPFHEDFESGWNDWSANNGIWEIGTPSDPNVGPQSPHDRPEWDANNLRCAGTIQNGNYEWNTDSMLISPTIQLPGTKSLQENEEIYLRFRHWFFYGDGDEGYVRIRLQDEETGNWSGWEKICSHPVIYSRLWTVKGTDLTKYAGKRVRIGFYHMADNKRELHGWYIDNIEIVVRQIRHVTPQEPFWEDFESGWNDWSANNGIWEIGTPSDPNVGPQSPHDRPEWDANNLRCAGTILNGNYEWNTDSMLISPTIQLPGTGSLQENEEIYLRFRHWFFYGDGDEGYVRIRLQDEKTGNWSDWEKICSHPVIYSRLWTVKGTDLTKYAGKRVRIGFYHLPDKNRELHGWYIDNIEIVVRQIRHVTPQKPFWEDFESGWDDWSANNGIWEIGTPSDPNVGPQSPHDRPEWDANNLQCAGTILNGNYEWHTNSMLISPTIQLPGTVSLQENEEIYLRFRHWFFYYDGDEGYVRIRVQDEETGNWSDWNDIGSHFTGQSLEWFHLKDVSPLTIYAGKKIRIGFFHAVTSNKRCNGWYIDDIEIGIFTDTNICYLDADNDKYGDPNHPVQGDGNCLPGYVMNNEDCDDSDPNTNPVALEFCDGKDNNCEGSVDEGLGETTCGIGECEVTVQNCENGILQTCTPGTPGSELCDGLDNNCNNQIDEDLVRGCSNVCGTGIETCVNGQWINCTAPVPPCHPICIFTAEITATGQLITGLENNISKIFIGIDTNAINYPSPGPPVDYTAYMEISEGLLEDYRKTGSDREEWGLNLTVGEKADPNHSDYFPVLSWDTNSFCPSDPNTGYFKLYSENDQGSRILLVDDMTRTSQYQTKEEEGRYEPGLDVYVFKYLIVWSRGEDFIMNLTAGWSMISLPVIPQSETPSSLFPDAVVMYRFERGSGYVRVLPNEELHFGTGYWILVNEDHNYVLTGNPKPSYYKTILSEGWEMIGGCTWGARPTVDNCHIAVIYSFDRGAGYKRVTDSEVLEPGRGFWIMIMEVDNQCELKVEVTDH